MKTLWEDGILQRIALLGLLIALFGLEPIPRQVAAGFERARHAQAASQPGAIATELAALAGQLPWRQDLWPAAGHAALAAADFDLAAYAFGRAAALGQLSPAGFLAWGDSDWQAGHANTAIQLWQIAARQGISPAETLPRLAQAHRSLGDQLALIEDLKALAALQSQSPAARATSRQSQAALLGELGLLLAAHDPAAAPPYLLQAAALDAGRQAEARALAFAIQRALSQDDPAYLLVVSGRALARQGAWDLAAGAFANAASLRPDYAEAWAYLGEARQRLGDERGALEALQAALQLDPQSLAALTLLGLYWQRQGDLDQALAALQAAAAIDPRNPALLADIGDLLASQGDLAAGERAYWQAIEAAPGEATYLRMFVEFCIRYNLDLRQTALPAARRAAASYPNDPQALDALGQVFFRLGDLFTAERFYLRALALDPTYAPVQLHLGILYRVQGQAWQARAYLARVIELVPGTALAEHARRTLEEILSP